MIPARKGSKRIKSKNRRLLNGKILMAHVIEKAKASKCFDEIFVNSDDPFYEKTAMLYKVGFYLRPLPLGKDEALNDDFVMDFIKSVDTDIIVQINPTNPLITIEDIQNVCDMSEYYDTVHSVKKIQIEIMYQRKPLNFEYYEKMPRSQDLVPAYAFSSGIMAWKTMPYIKNMMNYGCATYGCGKNVGYYELKGFSSIDIDNEEDFQLAEAIMNMKKGVIEYAQ